MVEIPLNRYVNSNRLYKDVGGAKRPRLRAGNFIVSPPEGVWRNLALTLRAGGRSVSEAIFANRVLMTHFPLSD